MFKCKLNISPKVFRTLFTVKPPNKYTLRSQFLIEPLVKNKVEEFSISFRGPHLWNKIIIPMPNFLNFEIASLSLFKKNLKHHISSLFDIKKYF